jgi:hypothetical protein
MALDTKDLYPGLIPDEDMEILNNIARNMLQYMRYFRFNLDGGVTFTNMVEADSLKGIRIAALDAIMDTHQKIVEVDGIGVSHCIIMPSNKFKRDTKVGVLFGMSIIASPTISKDSFLIKPM